MAVPDFLVAILAGARRVFAVVNVKSLKTIKAHNSVKLIENSVKISNDVIAGITHMAGVHAHPNLILKADPVNDCSNF